MALARGPVIYRAPSMSPELSESAKDEHEHPEEFVPRLLLPPPRTGLAALRYRAAVTVLRIAHSVGLDQAQVTYVARLGFFLVKMVSLARPCWPFMVNLEVSVPLVIVAALDVGVSSSAAMPLVRRRSREHHRLWMTRAWGFVTSVILLVLHLAVVWLARRWEALCIAATHQSTWDHWEPDPVEH